MLYAGRSGYTGLDQINVQVPASVSGCYVSVVVETGGYISNFGTIPVAANGRTCFDDSNPLPASLLLKISQTGSANIGLMGLSEDSGPTFDLSTGAIADGAFAGFPKVTAAQLAELKEARKQLENE